MADGRNFASHMTVDWSRNKSFGPSQGISLAVHVALIVLLTVPLIDHVVRGAPPAVRAWSSIVYAPYESALPPGDTQPHGGGGGGSHDPIPASLGRLPEFSAIQLAPPLAVLKNPNPIMAVVPTVIGPPEVTLQSPALANYGDPNAASVTASNGPGGPGGIGDGLGDGDGSGNSSGVGPGGEGGFGGGPRYEAGIGGVSYPTCMYCPPAKYTDAARKAKYEGTVVLQIVVSPDGRGTEIHVVKSLGMGLDEQAVAAVSGWRFKPATRPDGKPVPTLAEIEVTFRLL